MNPSGLVERALAGDRPAPGQVRLLAVGKAAGAMAAAALRVLGDGVADGLVIAPAAPTEVSRLETLTADHPIPSRRSEEAARRALALASGASSGQQLLVLLSGGASALMAAPVPGVTLEDKGATTDRLLRGGADIHALNTVRKHLSRVKGGWLAARTPVAVRTLAISDVVGDDPSFIGSGPTAADPTRFNEALAVLDRFGGRQQFPPAVRRRLERGAAGEIEETLKPGDPRLARASWALVGSRFDAMAGAAAEARRRGYEVRVVDAPIVGDARVAARDYLEGLRRLERGTRPTCLISSGETTVQVRGPGRGGRNQELAASVAQGLAGLSRRVLFASCGTDGIDGPTDAAGAIADDTTLVRAEAAGLSLPAVQTANDTYHFFAPLGDLILTGPTGTNVGDLQVCLMVSCPESEIR